MPATSGAFHGKRLVVGAHVRGTRSFQNILRTNGAFLYNVQLLVRFVSKDVDGR